METCPLLSDFQLGILQLKAIPQFITPVTIPDRVIELVVETGFRPLHCTMSSSFGGHTLTDLV